MGKVKITKEWAKAINALKDNEVKFENAFLDFMEQEIEMSEFKLDYESITSEEFSIAYLVGYEIYESQEDKLAFIYNSYKSSCELWHEAYCSGIVETLHILGIKIKGINE